MKNSDTVMNSMELVYTSTKARETSYIFVENRGLRRISYVEIDGNAYTQGDIFLGKADALRAIKRLVDEERRNPGPEAIVGVGPHGRRWPRGVVPFNVQPALQVVVTPAIAAWESKAPVRFVPRTTEGDFVSFETGAGCNSSVGMQGGRQIITLGVGCGVGQAMHEIGHALGLWHEQSRADRDQYVVIHYENIIQEDISEFNTVGAEGQDVGPYDYDSIMHYGPYDFSKNGRKTIEPKVPGVTIGQRTHLSSGDIAGVIDAYRDGSLWRGLPGWASDVGAGGGRIWVTGGEDGIFRWGGSDWEGMSGQAYRVAVDGSGFAWVVNRQGAIFRWTGGAWEGLPGWASDIGVGGPPGNPSAWVIVESGPGGHKRIAEVSRRFARLLIFPISDELFVGSHWQHIATVRGWN